MSAERRVLKPGGPARLPLMLLGLGVAALVVGVWVWRSSAREAAEEPPVVLLDPVSADDAFLNDLIARQISGEAGRPRPTLSESDRDVARAEGEALLQRIEARDCAVGGDVSAAYFSPRQARAGEVLDQEPFYVEGEEVYISHIGDLMLPTGRLLATGGEYLGSDDDVDERAVSVAEPGSYGYYHLMVGDGAFARPLFAQLVLDPDNQPVRWEADDRFGSGTDGGINWLGSPETSIDTLAPTSFELPPLEADHLGIVNEILFHGLLDRLDASEESCVWFEVRGEGQIDRVGHPRPRTSAVLFSNGYGDGWTPAAAGYGADGELVAITWFLRTGSWLLAGIPGEPPDEVQQQIECRRSGAC